MITRATYWWLLDHEYYRQIVREAAERLNSDGCSGVPDFYKLACLDHDIAYRTHCDVFGKPLTKELSDSKLRWAIQYFSPLGRLSPMSYWRWAAVNLFGQDAWDGKAVICYKSLFGGSRIGSSFLNPTVRP